MDEKYDDTTERPPAGTAASEDTCGEEPESETVQIQTDTDEDSPLDFGPETALFWA